MMLKFYNIFLIGGLFVIGLSSGCNNQRLSRRSAPVAPSASVTPNSGTLDRFSRIYNHVPPRFPIVPGTGSIKLVVSVDWEGRESIPGTLAFDSRNLQAMINFRASYPDLHLWHFLNPAYFSKPGADASTIRSQIRQTIRDGDELGLHLHGWKRLFESAEVVFNPEEDMSGTALECDHDCGHGVPITSYTSAELRAVLRKSIQIQTDQGFPRPTSFRAGAWLSAPHVLEALAAEGFLVDSSEVPIRSFDLDYLEMSYFTLGERLLSLWSEATSLSQPHFITTSHGLILEHPNNGLLSDWISARKMYQDFLDIVNEYALHPNQTFYYHVGFHQESAELYLPSLKLAIDNIRDYALRFNIPLKMARFPEDLAGPSAVELDSQNSSPALSCLVR